MLCQSIALSSQIKHHCQSARMAIPTHFLSYYGSCPNASGTPLILDKIQTPSHGVSLAFSLQLYILLLSPSKLMLQKRWITRSLQNMPCGKCASANTRPDERRGEGGRKSPAKFRAAWTHGWRTGPSKLTNSSPDGSVFL